MTVFIYRALKREKAGPSSKLENAIEMKII